MSLNLSKNYQTKADADKSFATKAELTATSDSISTSVSKTYATKGELSKKADSTSTSVMYTFSVATNQSKWWYRLGRLVSNGDASSVTIHVMTGNGYNGSDFQNSEFWIFVKDGWQSSLSATMAFGVTVDLGANCSGVDVRVFALSSDTCDVWVKLPWQYPNGRYSIQGSYKSWTHNAAQDNQTAAPAPSGQVAQAVSIRTIAPTSYVDSQVKQTADSITSTVSKTYQPKGDYATSSQLSQVKQTADSVAVSVKTAQSTADAAKTSAASAAAAASSAATAAKTAQSTADTAKANAATANSNATNAQSRVGTIETLVRASGSGVEVAKKVNGSYTSTKTLMDDTGFSVLDKAGTVLSKFGSSLIELGRNSANAVIEMCDSLLSISARKNENGATVARMFAPSNNSGIELSCEGSVGNGDSVDVASQVYRFSNRGVFGFGADYVNSSSSVLTSASVRGYADGNSSEVSLSAYEILIDCSKLTIADLRNNVEMRGAQLVTDWTYLWGSLANNRYVRWCVRMGVCYVEVTRVNGVTSSGWQAGKLPKSVWPPASTYHALACWHRDHTAQMWVGGANDGGGEGQVWLYNNGTDDVFGSASWPIG